MSKVNISELWEELCKELKEENRFFAQNKIIEILDQIEFAPFFPDEKEDILYRARVGNYLKQSDKEILAPPKSITDDGRCNPKGISYLYLSTDEYTAICEVKPNPGEDVTIATLKVNLKNIIYFYPHFYEKLPCFRENLTEEQLTLLKCIDYGMSRKINDKRKLEYLPFQYITEYIKRRGYNGFLYRSTVGTGHNLVMFDWENNVKVDDKNKVTIESVKYEYKK